MESYVIQRASETGFLVQALEPDGTVVAELDESMDEPRRLKAPDCNWEYEALFARDVGRPTEHEVLEPYSEDVRATRFLDWARRDMKEYHLRNLDYPDTWEELGMHWAEVKHTRNDPRALPPPGTGASWKPLGSRLTYQLTRVNADHYMIAAYDDRGQLKNFCDPATPPQGNPRPEVTK